MHSMAKRVLSYTDLQIFETCVVTGIQLKRIAI